MHAGFSARHISFIETGRTQPSRDALLVLAESLEVPLRERNRLLTAGGFAHVYKETQTGGRRHGAGAPRPAIHPRSAHAVRRPGIDRFSTCLMGNAASARLLAAVADPSLLTPNANMLRLVFHPLGLRRFIVNWPDVLARVLLDRAERELTAADDEPAAVLLRENQGAREGCAETGDPPPPVR